MKQQQTHLINLNTYRKTELELEFYSDMAQFLEELDSDEKIAPYLNDQLLKGKIKSIDDLSKFFRDKYKEGINIAQGLKKEIA